MQYGGIDILRHLLALSVILSHTYSSRYSPDTLSSIQIFKDLFSVSVFGFSMVAGFFFNPARVPETRAEFGSLVLSRMRRLIIPFALFTLIYAIALDILNKGDMADILWGSFSFIPGAGHLYYLPLLFYMDVLAALYVRLTRSLTYGRLLTGAIMASLVAACLFLPTGYVSGSNPRLFPAYFLCFMIGALLKRAYQDGRIVQAATQTVAVGVALGFAEFKFWKIAGVVALFSFAVTQSKRFKWLHRRFPGAGGVYLLHTPVLNFGISIMLEAVYIAELTNVLLTVALTYFVALAVTLGWARLAPRARFLVLE